MKKLNATEQKNITGGFTTTVYCLAYSSGCLRTWSSSDPKWSNGKGSFKWWLPKTYTEQWYKYYYLGAMACYQYDADHC